jgi:hypothetical protein
MSKTEKSAYSWTTGILDMMVVREQEVSISVSFSGTLTGSCIFVVWHVAHPLMYALINSIIPS